MPDPSRDELLAWLMHDLRGPLTGIQVMAEALEDGLAPDPGAHYRQIQQEVQRMTRMVDDLAELALSGTAGVDLVPEHVRLTPLLADALSSAGPLAQAYGVHLVGAPAPSVSAFVDPGEFSRVLTNLVLNAIRHTPSGGSVTMSVSTLPGQVQLAIADGCGGMSADGLARAFDAAWQGPRSPQVGARPNLDQGRGLGLSIVRSIVEAHRGTVQVENHQGGCRFLVSLPLAA